MCAWFGPYKAANMNGAVHCNAVGGRLIANEMLKQILLMFPITKIRENQIQKHILSNHSIRCMPDKIILMQQNNQPYRIKLIGMNGRLVANLHGAGAYICKFVEDDLKIKN
jgi:hypothetical protein